MMESSDSSVSQLSTDTTGNYDLTLSPGVDTAPGTVSIEGDDFAVDAVGRVTTGDTLTVEATVPDDADYIIEIYNSEQLVQGAADPGADDVVEFDTTDIPPNGYELTPGTLGVTITNANNTGDFKEAHPLVVRAYEMGLETRTAIESGDELDVTATLDPLPVASEYTVKEVKLRYWNGNVSSTATMSADGNLTYTATLSDPPAETFDCQAAVLIDSDSEEVDSESIGVTDAHTVDVVDSSDTLAIAGESTTAGAFPQFASPAVGTDSLFVGGLGSALEAFPKDNIADGTTPTWAVQRAGALSDSSPVLANGALYVGSGGGRLYALDTTGETTWEFDTGDAGTASAITATPAVDSGRNLVYVATNDGSVYAVSTGSDGGTAQWDVDVGGPVHSGVTVGSGRAFLTTADGRLVAVDPDTQTVESTTLEGRFDHRGPLVDDGTVYVAAAGVHAFDASKSLESAESEWSRPDGFTGSVRSAPALVDGQVVVGDDGSVHALDAPTGGRNWQYDTGDPVVATPRELDTRALVGTTGGDLLLFGSSGAVRGLEYPGVPIRSRPVVDGDTVYLPTARGTTTAESAVLALDVTLV